MTEPKRVLIVDDEPLALQKLARYLKQSGFSFLVEEADSGPKAVEAIQTFHPDLVFLDIEMPGFSGLEVLRQFETRPFLVVFQTAFDEYALQAFEEHACDYLLKPFTPQRFQKTLEHVLGRLANDEQLRALENKLAQREGPLRKLSVKLGNRIRILEEPTIECFVSKNHYTCVYFDGAHEALSDLSLSYLATRLDPTVFKQLHRNSIVNVSLIQTVSTSRDGEVTVELSNGMALPVSRNNRKALKTLLKSLH